MATTNDYEPIEIHGYFRSHTHLPIWEVLDKAGIWRRVGITVDFTSSEAEAALFEGRVDLVSGNHISPYALVARGKPHRLIGIADQRRQRSFDFTRADQFARANTRQARHRHDRAGQWWRL